MRDETAVAAWWNSVKDSGYWSGSIVGMAWAELWAAAREQITALYESSRPRFVPAHALTCHLAHNPHKLVDMSIEQFVEDEWNDEWHIALPEGELARAIATGSLWIVHWYDEPGKLKAVAAASLDAIAKHLEQTKTELHRE